MHALRLIVLSLVTPAASRSAVPAVRSGRDRIYDPYSLGTRPLPADLRLHPHPRQLSPMRLQEILGRK